MQQLLKHFGPARKSGDLLGKMGANQVDTRWREVSILSPIDPPLTIDRPVDVHTEYKLLLNTGDSAERW